MAGQRTRVESIITRLKNNRIISLILVFGIAVIAVASFTDAAQKIVGQLQRFYSPQPAALALRSEPAVVSADELKVSLAKYGFFEKRWNPTGDGIAHQYEFLVNGDQVTVLDSTTKLQWQKNGSPAFVTFDQALQYATEMNTALFAGFGDWRLPTAEEALSIMERNSSNGVYIGEQFDRHINSIWTADRTPEGRVWTLYFYDGILSTEEDSFHTWARLVRSH